jgi:hypothetical protein
MQTGSCLSRKYKSTTTGIETLQAVFWSSVLDQDPNRIHSSCKILFGPLGSASGSVSLLYRSVPVPKCHRSGTLAQGSESRHYLLPSKLLLYCTFFYLPVLRIRIRIRRFRMFLVLLEPDPDPFVRSWDPDPPLDSDPLLDTDLDPSITKQKL